MKNTFLMTGFMMMFASCNSEKNDMPKKAEEHYDQVVGNVVTLTGLQMKTAGIELGSIEHKNLKTAIKANGMLSVPNQNKAFITSVSSGVITTLLVQPGSFVREGQVIATIVNPEVARLQQQLQEVNAQIELNEIELKRQQELVEGNAAPLKNVQRVQTELATQKASRNSLRQQLTILGISPSRVSKGAIITTLAITAPISGTISNLSAQIGSNVDQATPIGEIVNNSQFHLDLFVYEKDLARVRPNQIIHFTLTNNAGKEYDAQIYSIGTAFANESKTIPIHAVVKGDKTGLIEGMNITAVISIGEEVVPAVPTEAIVTYQGQHYIFLKSDRGADDHHLAGESKENVPSDTALNFQRVQVVKGVTDIGYTEITFVNTVSMKSLIIARGAFFAMAKMTNTGEDEH